MSKIVASSRNVTPENYAVVSGRDFKIKSKRIKKNSTTRVSPDRLLDFSQTGFEYRSSFNLKRSRNSIDHRPESRHPFTKGLPEVNSLNSQLTETFRTVESMRKTVSPTYDTSLILKQTSNQCRALLASLSNIVTSTSSRYVIVGESAGQYS